MITFRQGNLLEADVDAVVNTVNTVGIMGKGIALMFKEQFPGNFAAYEKACKNDEVRLGRMFVTENMELLGPKWIINFPTKTHWRVKTKPEWIEEGLKDLVRVIRENGIGSIAIPPLGCGNGGLDWQNVRPMIESALRSIEDVDAVVYEPTERYQNVTKRNGVSKLTPASALVAEIVRRYCVIGIECSILEVQKLGWFMDRGVQRFGMGDPLRLNFVPKFYGPYSHNLQKLLDSLDGSYLHCDKRLSDAAPVDPIWFIERKRDLLSAYLESGEGRIYASALEWTSTAIDGFQSPLGMELLATVDWMIQKDRVEPNVDNIMAGLGGWAGEERAATRKLRIFDQRSISIALERLDQINSVQAAATHP